MLFPFLKSYSCNLFEQAIYDRPKRKRTEYLTCLDAVFTTRLRCVVLPFLLLRGILWSFCHYIPSISHFHPIKPLCLKNWAASKKSVLSFLLPCLAPQTTDPAWSVTSLLNFALPLRCPHNLKPKRITHNHNVLPHPPILSKRACCGPIIKVKNC